MSFCEPVRAYWPSRVRADPKRPAGAMGTGVGSGPGSAGGTSGDGVAASPSPPASAGGTVFGTQGGNIGTPLGEPPLLCDVPILFPRRGNCFFDRRGYRSFGPGIKELWSPRLVRNTWNKTRCDLRRRPLAEKSREPCSLRRISCRDRQTSLKNVGCAPRLLLLRALKKPAHNHR